MANDGRGALDRMEDLVDRFIAPAADLLAEGEDRGYRFYDLSGAAGTFVHGLTLGQLAHDFPDLQPPPDDAALERALGAYGLEVTDAEHRAAFFRAWMAQRAAWDLAQLADKVAASAAPEDRAERAWELDRLRALAAAPLPTIERRSLERAVESRAVSSV
jgi:hypothetical protein